MTDVTLAGSWTLYDAEGAPIAPCPIPGDVHSALIAAGRIPDPMVGTSEADVQWVHEAEWEIRRSFDLPAQALAGKWPVLDLEFVDTVAEVTVNGTAVARLEFELHPPPHRSCRRRAPGGERHLHPLQVGNQGSNRAGGQAALPDPAHQEQPRPRPQYAAQGAMPRRLGLGARA